MDKEKMIEKEVDELKRINRSPLYIVSTIIILLATVVVSDVLELEIAELAYPINILKLIIIFVQIWIVVRAFLVPVFIINGDTILAYGRFYGKHSFSKQNVIGINFKGHLRPLIIKLTGDSKIRFFAQDIKTKNLKKFMRYLFPESFEAVYGELGIS
ncbi:MAG: hypothetical protein HYZ14_02470 [Bacteroidetes bacterium]|nr:hypothetical protein [Bacteroidota bacterium]